MNRNYKRKFIEKINKYFDKIDLINLTGQICLLRPTVKEMNRLDKTITYIINCTRQYIEDLLYHILYSKIKV